MKTGAASLTQRARAYRSLSTGMPWQERLALAAIGRDRYNAARKAAAAKSKAQSQDKLLLEQTRDL